MLAFGELKRTGSLAKNTQRNYNRIVKAFWQWAETPEKWPIPPALFEKWLEHYHNMAIEYVKDPDKRKPVIKWNTLITYANALASVQQSKDGPNLLEPYRVLLADMRAEWERAGLGVSKSHPVRRQELEWMLNQIPDTVIGTRDRALLWFLWTGGRRRSEASAATFENLTKNSTSIQVTIPKTKNKQSVTSVMTYESYRAMAEWISLLDNEGPIFRSLTPDGEITDKAISPGHIWVIVRKYADRARLNVTPHAFRAGFITQCGLEKIPLSEVQRLTGHHCLKTLLGYYRLGQLQVNPATRLAKAVR